MPLTVPERGASFTMGLFLVGLCLVGAGPCAVCGPHCPSPELGLSLDDSLFPKGALGTEHTPDPPTGTESPDWVAEMDP